VFFTDADAWARMSRRRRRQRLCRSRGNAGDDAVAEGATAEADAGIAHDRNIPMTRPLVLIRSS
jgi:hypothetical protein